MPGYKVVIKKTPEAAIKTLDKKLKAIGDFNRLHEEVSIELDRWTQKNFKAEGRLTMDGWKPLAAGGRATPGGGFDSSAKILQDTGRLRISFKPFANKRNAGIGSDLIYSEPHEKGLGHLPKRQMLPKWPDVEKRVNQVFDFHVKRGTRA